MPPRIEQNTEVLQIPPLAEVSIMDRVSVRLNPSGKEFYQRRKEDLKDKPLQADSKEEGSKLQTRVWDLLRTFGPTLRNGAVVPFQDNEIIIGDNPEKQITISGNDDVFIIPHPFSTSDRVRTAARIGPFVQMQFWELGELFGEESLVTTRLGKIYIPVRPTPQDNRQP